MVALVRLGSLTLLACLTILGAIGTGPKPPPPPAPALVQPGDWPMYAHDPQHTSFNPDETAISAANVDQLVPRWQARIESGPNPAFSTPSMADGRVYVGSSVLTGTNFFAFDATTGAPTWAANLGRSNDCFNVGIGATAAVSGTVLVVGGGDSAYYGLDARTGAQLWRHPLGVGGGGFAWESPLLANGRAYLGVASGCDAPQVRGEIRAVDLQTGDQIASRYFVPQGEVGGTIWNSPALSPDGNTLAITTGEDRAPEQIYTRAMVTLDPLSLAIRQAHQESTPDGDMDFGTSPLLFHDQSGRTLVGAVHKNGVFYAYDLSEVAGGTVWKRDVGGLVSRMPAYDPTAGEGGRVYAFGSQVHALDPTTGAETWVSPALGQAWGNLAIANGLIFVNTDNGVDVLDENTGRLLRRLVPAYVNHTYSGVIVAHGFVYWMSGCYLNAWSLPGPPPPATPTPATPTPATPVPTPATCDIHFRDVCGCDYFYEPVRYLFCAGALSGYADGTFRPTANTTRGQLSKIVVGGEGWAIDTSGGPHFADVPPTHPFYPYVETAYHHQLISGYADGTFRSGADVTRGQLVKIIVQAAGWTIDTSGGPHFGDVPPTHPFYPYVETAYHHAIVSGYGDGTFRQGNPATRAQIAKIFYLALTAP